MSGIVFSAVPLLLCLMFIKSILSVCRVVFIIVTILLFSFQNLLE